MHINKRITAVILIIVLCLCTACASDDASRKEQNSSNSGGSTKQAEDSREGTSEAVERTYEDVVHEENYTEDEDKDGTETVITWTVSQCRKAEKLEYDINKKLEEDGYPFRLKIDVHEDLEDYKEYVETCDSDIVFTRIFNEGDQVWYRPPGYFNARDGLFKQLDAYLEGSRLKDFIPEELWNSVLLDGKTFCIPNAAVIGESSSMILFKKDRYTQADIESFDGTTAAFERLLGEDGILVSSPDIGGGHLKYCGIEVCYGTAYYLENNQIKNVMENDEHIAWLNYKHKLHNEERLYLGGDYKENEELDWSIAISVCTSPYDIPEDEYYAIKYTGIVKDHFLGAIGIKATSKNPGKAFDLLQLLITDSEYANLVIYGDDFEEVDGYAVSKEDGTVAYTYPVRMCFGINTGIWRSNDPGIFKTSEDWKQFIKENVVYREEYMQRYPEQLNELYLLYNKWDRIITGTDEEFEFGLKKLITKSKEIFDSLPDGGKVE